MNITNNKKIILMAILISVFVFVIIFGATFFYLNKNKNIKTNNKKYYLNIDENKVIENPSKEDVKNLIDHVYSENSF